MVSNYEATIPRIRFASTKSRQEVAVETLEAIRLGQVTYSGEYESASAAARLGPVTADRYAAGRRTVPQQ